MHHDLWMQTLSNDGCMGFLYSKCIATLPSSLLIGSSTTKTKTTICKVVSSTMVLPRKCMAGKKKNNRDRCFVSHRRTNEAFAGERVLTLAAVATLLSKQAAKRFAARR